MNDKINYNNTQDNIGYFKTALGLQMEGEEQRFNMGNINIDEDNIHINNVNNKTQFKFKNMYQLD
jgi:hypothetical protein